MKKYAYLARLEELLSALPADERQDALSYYEEFFDAAGADDSDAAGLEPPERAAAKILEGEGVAQPEAPAAPAEPPQPVPEQSSVQPPASPEPPPLEEPQSYPAGGTAGRQPPRPFSRKGWLQFLAVLAIAFVVQLAILVLNFATTGRHVVIETAASDDTAPTVETQEPITEYVTGDIASRAEPVVTPEPTELPATQTGYAQNMVCAMERGDSLGIKLRSGKVFLEVNEDINDRSAYIGVRNADNSFAVQQTDDGDWLIGSTDHSGELVLTVKIPRGLLSDVQVKLDKGNISVMDNLTLEELELETGSGRITTQNLSAVEVELKTNDGHVTTGVVTPGEKLEVSADNGAAQLVLAGVRNDYSLYLVSKNGVLHENGETAAGKNLKSLQTNRPAVTVQADGDITLEYSGS